MPQLFTEHLKNYTKRVIFCIIVGCIIMENFGQRLKHLRNSRHITQADLAVKLGVSTSAVSMYEKGNREPNNSMLKKICAFFGVSVNYLLNGEPEGPRDISELLDEIKARLDEPEGIIVNGKIITAAEKDKLFNAMLVAVSVMFPNSLQEHPPISFNKY